MMQPHDLNAKECRSYHTGTAVLTELRCCILHERIYHCSDTYQTPQSPPALEYERGSLGRICKMIKKNITLDYTLLCLW